MQKKIVLIVVISAILFAIIMYVQYISGYILFGFEDTNATTERADMSYQYLPKWEYKILKDGTVYYRETQGCITNSKIETWINDLVYFFSYKPVKKIDEDTLKRMDNYLSEQIINKQKGISPSSNNSDYYDFENYYLDSQYHIKVKENYKWTTLNSQLIVEVLKDYIGE